MTTFARNNSTYYLSRTLTESIMKFTSAAKVEEVVWLMKEAELRRSTNRANLNRLFNGEPPLTACEAEENNANTNVNFLEGTKIIHDATSQFNNAFMKPGNYFSVTIDSAPVDKKMEYGRKVTRAINRIMKRSLPYIECTRSKYANVVLHGPGPINWEERSPGVWVRDQVAETSRTPQAAIDVGCPWAVVFQATEGFQVRFKGEDPALGPHGIQVGNCVVSNERATVHNPVTRFNEWQNDRQHVLVVVQASGVFDPNAYMRIPFKDRYSIWQYFHVGNFLPGTAAWFRNLSFIPTSAW